MAQKSGPASRGQAAQVPLLPCGREQPKKQESDATIGPDHPLRVRVRQALAEQGLKKSVARDRVIETLFTGPHHFNSREMVARVRAQYPGVGAATVYRTIAFLVEAGVLHESLMDEGRQKVFELSSEEHHDHIVCLDCGALFEFHDAAIETLQHAVSESRGFREVRHRHVIHAHCELLSQKRR